MIGRMSASLVSLCIVAGLAAADDWPQFRGLQRDGHSKETGLLQEWPEKGPPRVWTFKGAGLGFSSVAVVKDMLYTLGTNDDHEIVIGFHVKKRGTMFITKIGPIFTYKGNEWGDGPRGTPTIDGNYLYAIGGQGVLVCLDIADKGKIVWTKDFIKDFDGEMMTEWGYSESPLVDGDLVICTPGGAKGTVIALDKKSGAEVWRTKELKNKAPYSSPVVAELHGVRQYLQASAIDDEKGGVLSGIAAKDGKVLWTTPLYKGMSYALAPTILVTGNTVYVALLSETLENTHAFDIGPDWKITDRFNAKAQNGLRNFHGGVVLIDGKIYGHSKGPGWTCQDLKTGKIQWNEREALAGGSGSIAAADGCLYLYSDEGEVALLKADPKEWNELGRFSIPEKSKIPKTRPTSRASKTWAHPVIADGHLYLRDHEFIFCYDIRAKK